MSRYTRLIIIVISIIVLVVILAPLAYRAGFAVGQG